MTEALYTAFEPAFRRFVRDGEPLRQLWGDGRWTEGPVHLPLTRAVVFSDIPNDRQMLYSELSGLTHELRGGRRHFTNGATLDRQGRMLVCEHGTRSLARIGHDGQRTLLADIFEGGRLNSPNDVAVHADGTIWFTDPSYGIESHYEGCVSPREQNGNHVYRYDPTTGALDAVARDFAYPNGIAFSPDGALLYVADSGGSRSPGNERHIRVFTLDEKRLTGGNVLAECPNGVFDGFRLDTEGRLWTSASDGVCCFSPDGTCLGRIAVPETVSNLCFGGPRNTRLYITATHSLYAIELCVRGAALL
jgi:gluconolactonase